jgi:fructose-specific phosphotransferase system IIC component
MPKALCIFGAAVAGLLVLAFGVDLAIGFPFGGVRWWWAVGFIVCSAILGYLSWTTLREQV